MLGSVEDACAVCAQCVKSSAPPGQLRLCCGTVGKSDTGIPGCDLLNPNYANGLLKNFSQVISAYKSATFLIQRIRNVVTQIVFKDSLARMLHEVQK